MFERNELYRVYKISIPIIDLLVPYWNLYINIKGLSIIDTLEFPAGYESYKKHCTEIYNDYQQKKEHIADKDDSIQLEETTINQILCVLTRYICANIYNREHFFKAFKKHFFTIVHKEDSFFCLTKDCNEEKMIGLLDKFLTNSNPIRLLLQTIDRNSEKNFDDMINCGLYSVAAQKTIDSSDIRSIYAPVYHISDFKTTENEHVSYELSSNEYWLNYDLIKEYYNLEEEQDTKAIVFAKQNNDSISHIDGLYIKDVIIPFISDFKKQYQVNLNAIWREFKSNVYHHKSEKNDNINRKNNKKQKEFLQLVKNEEVTNKLSYLVNNLFIPQEHISKIEGLESCFNDVTIVEGLSELENYEFFSSNIENDKPFIGIHKKDKAGSSSYKLLHYINRNAGKLENIRGHNNISKCTGKIAKVLKPDLAFYYLLRYYEDFFSLALNEVKQETGNIIDFVANQNLRINSSENEVDILAFNGTDIYIIELKTTLNIDYIISYQKKCNKWLQHNPEIANNMKFIIAGNFGSETLNICGKKEECDGYNEARPNMNGYAYSFSIPLNEEHELYCFTESSFERLKSKLTKILIKDEASSN